MGLARHEFATAEAAEQENPAHCSLATLQEKVNELANVVITHQEKVLDLDDVVTVLETDIEDHQGVIQALRDCNASLRHKLDVAIEAHQVLLGPVFEPEQGRERQ